MKSTFDTKEYLKSLGVDLVNAFDKAGQTTHPQSVGSGREKSVKDQLQRVLPAGVGVGSGFVIDSFGNTSEQCDIIIYEKDLALKFSPNDDDLYSYYNCECVIAVGQVKSDASIQDVRNSIQNLKRVRELQRFQKDTSDMSKPNQRYYRSYLSTLTICGVPSQQFDPLTKAIDQIYTFLICKSFKAPANSILAAIKEIANDRLFYPNRLLSIDGNYCFWLNVPEKRRVEINAIGSSHFTMQKVECVLGQLISELTDFIKTGRSVPLNNSVYLPNLYSLSFVDALYEIEEMGGRTLA